MTCVDVVNINRMNVLSYAHMLTRDVGEASLRISEHSLISTMKVERPRAISSDAPMRVRMLSNKDVVHESAGT